MAIRDILSISTGECRYCLTADTPFLFCADATAPGSSYCATHHAVCYRGQGRDVGLLESMIYGMEDTVVRRRTRPEQVANAVDVVVRG